MKPYEPPLGELASLAATTAAERQEKSVRAIAVQNHTVYCVNGRAILTVKGDRIHVHTDGYSRYDAGKLRDLSIHELTPLIWCLLEVFDRRQVLYGPSVTGNSNQSHEMHNSLQMVQDGCECVFEGHGETEN